MDHFVAYHSVELMGHDYSPDDQFDYRSRKPERLLRGSFGGMCWLIVGTPSPTRTEYRLAGVYTPTSIRSDGDVWVLEGWGTPLRPPPTLTDLPWFVELRRSQANFSLGFNRLTDAAIVDALEALISHAAATSAVGAEPAFDPAGVADARSRVLSNIVRRQGQGTFRAGVLRAYESSCAVSGCIVEEILEAAHILPYRGPETNHVQNGILLRADIHTLFDLGLIGVDESTMTIVTADTLEGSEYAHFHGQSLRAPKDTTVAPSRAALEHHRVRSGLLRHPRHGETSRSK
jgi:hypothetical protein